MYMYDNYFVTLYILYVYACQNLTIHSHQLNTHRLEWQLDDRSSVQ